MDYKSKIILISVSTASGKSDFAIKLAKKINGEIINADSMQVYKQFKILTARPKNIDLKIIKHSGGLPGVSTFSMMIPSEKSGVVVLINKNEVKASNLAEMIFNIMRGKIYRNKLDEPLKFNIDYHNNIIYNHSLHWRYQHKA